MTFPHTSTEVLVYRCLECDHAWPAVDSSSSLRATAWQLCRTLMALHSIEQDRTAARALLREAGNPVLPE